MFQTLGNLHVNPSAGLLFMDFQGGDILQLSGKAETVWEEERAAEFVGAERVIDFHIEEVIETRNAHRLRWEFLSYSTRNPGEGQRPN